MKKATFLLLLLCNLSFAQDYFKGENLYCESKNAKAKDYFKTGIETLHLNTRLDKKYLKMTAAVFFNAYKADSTFCDAIFFSGYTYGLVGERKIALGCYYLADSLSNNKSIEFKINLAAEALKVGNRAGLELARKKYNEIIQYFPHSAEGYYGFAITSPEFGDYEKGLECLNVAISKYYYPSDEKLDELNYLKGILLTLNKKYDEGLKYLEKSSSSFKKDMNYKIHYSLCLLKVSEIYNDEKMKEKAKKIYAKIENKEQIPNEIKDLLIF